MVQYGFAIKSLPVLKYDLNYNENIERGFCSIDLHQTLETAIPFVVSTLHGEFAVRYEHGTLAFMKQAKNLLS